MESLLVAFIINMCKGDIQKYRLQNEYIDCIDWYVNCSINKNINVETLPKKDIEFILKECKNAAQK